MAKVFIFVPYERAGEWCEKPFSGLSVTELPVCGKPWVEYALDRAASLGVERALVLDYEYSQKLSDRLVGDGRKRWPMDVTYTGSCLISSADEVKHRYAAFIGDDEPIIVTGTRFPLGDEWRLVTSVRDYYALNFDLLAEPRGAVLPGYPCEKGVWIGENVQLKTGAKISAPAVLGDDTRIDHGCRLTGGCIVGDGALLDEGASIAGTIVFPNTYIGRDTEFACKIVTANRVIDGETGAWVDLSDLGLSSSIHQYMGVGLKAFEWLIAFVLAAVFLVPYHLWLPFSRRYNSSLWAYKLSIDRYHKIWLVLRGKADLVRSGGAEWAFHPSDGLTRGRTASQRKLDEAYYNYNRNARLIVDVVVKGVVNRLFSNEWARSRDLVASRGRRFAT